MGLAFLSDVSEVFHQTIHYSTFGLTYVDFATCAAFDPVHEIGTSARDICSSAVPSVRGG